MILTFIDIRRKLQRDVSLLNLPILQRNGVMIISTIYGGGRPLWGNLY